MTWLDAPKSEHEVRREHYVAGRQDERERIVGLLHTQHKAEHIAEPSGVCRAFRILALIAND
jgi:hypothetical protein